MSKNFYNDWEWESYEEDSSIKNSKKGNKKFKSEKAMARHNERVKGQKDHKEKKNAKKFEELLFEEE